VHLSGGKVFKGLGGGFGRDASSSSPSQKKDHCLFLVGLMMEEIISIREEVRNYHADGHSGFFSLTLSLLRVFLHKILRDESLTPISLSETKRPNDYLPFHALGLLKRGRNNGKSTCEQAHPKQITTIRTIT